MFSGHSADYDVIREIGSGAHARTFRARIREVRDDPGWLTGEGPPHGDTVLIKSPRIEKDRPPQEIRQFLGNVCGIFDQELGALKRLSSVDGVARVYDWGDYLETISDSGDVAIARFLVQEYVKGDLLTEYLQREFALPGRAFNGIASAADFFRLAESMVDILKAVHLERVIHGDIWPRNIIIVESGEPILIDFGSSRFRDDRYQCGREEPSHAYCAPERRNGYREGRRSDIYSMGGTFFYMATGEDPPREPIADDDRLKLFIVNRIKDRNPRLLEENHGVADLIARCLRIDKDARTPHADALLSDIRTFSFGLRDRARGSDLVSVGEKLLETLSALRDSGNTLLANMVELDLVLLTSHVEDMKHGIWELSGDHENIVSHLCRYLMLLEADDTLFIRSVPRLWYSENLGLNGRFLTMIKLMAQRGTRIINVFLTCDEDRYDPKVEQIIVAHRAMVQELERVGCQNLQVRYLPVTSDERATRQRDDWDNAVVLRGDRPKLIDPIYDQNNLLRTVRFLSRYGSADRIRRQMGDALAEALPLDEWEQGAAARVGPISGRASASG